MVSAPDRLVLAAAVDYPTPSNASTIEVLRRPVESVQYTSQQFVTAAGHLGVRLSVGGKGQCWDNAVAESFFATIKAELVDRQSWPTRAGLHAVIFDWIKGWYNIRRRHSSLGYLSPDEFERWGCQVEFAVGLNYTVTVSGEAGQAQRRRRARCPGPRSRS